MLANITICERLKDLRIERGLTLEELSAQTGIPRSTLGDYEANDEKLIGYQGLVQLSKFYGVSTDYLFGITNIRQSVNTELAELHLTDAVVDGLKSKRWNIRLLSELIENEHFPDLMANMEIYIDGLASIQINTLNSIIQSVRDLIKEQHNPDEKDLYMRTFEAGLVKEERYFHSVIHDDIDAIVDNLRQQHMENKKDTLVTSENIEVTQILIESLKKASTMGGTIQEKQVSLFLGLLGVDSKKINQNERNVLASLARKSNYAWKKK